jgi:PAS domain S-box-containing protein
MDPATDPAANTGPQADPTVPARFVAGPLTVSMTAGGAPMVGAWAAVEALVEALGGALAQRAALAGAAARVAALAAEVAECRGTEASLVAAGATLHAAVERTRTLAAVRDQILDLPDLLTLDAHLRGPWLEALRGLGVPVYRLSVQMPSAQRGCYQQHWSFVLPPAPEARLDIPLSQCPWVGEAWASGRTVVVDRQRLAAMGFPPTEVAWLAEIPLSDGGGSLGVSSQEPLGFTTGDLAALEEFAGLLAVALRRTRDLELLRRSEERYRTILNTAMDGFWVADAQGHLLEVNDAYCRMSGYDRSELIGLPIAALEARERPVDVERHLAAVAASGADRFQSQHRRKDGTLFDVEVSVQFRAEEAGNRVAFLRDITARHRAERATRVNLAVERIRNLIPPLRGEDDWLAVVAAVEQELCGLLGPVRCQVATVDAPAGQVYLYRPAGTGASRKSALPHLLPVVQELVAQGQPVVQRGDRLQALWGDGLDGPAAVDVQLPFGAGVLAVSAAADHDLDAEQVAIVQRFAPLLAEAHSRVQEMAWRRRAEAELAAQRLQAVQADRLRALGEMATGVAHELNQPLNGIRAFAEGMLLGMERQWSIPAAEQQETLRDIIAQVDRITVIIDHMRVFARDESEQSAVAFALATPVTGALKLLGAQLRVHGIALHNQVTDDLPLCQGWPNQVEQVLLNLLTNARDALDLRVSQWRRRRPDAASAWRPEIAIDAQLAHDGRAVELRVSDNGGGIDPAIVDRVFEPFFTTKGVGKGTGLGLAIVRGIIDRHQGSVRIDNRPGEGLAVAVALPCAARPLAAGCGP